MKPQVSVDTDKELVTVVADEDDWQAVMYFVVRGAGHMHPDPAVLNDFLQKNDKRNTRYCADRAMKFMGAIVSQLLAVYDTKKP